MTEFLLMRNQLGKEQFWKSDLFRELCYINVHRKQRNPSMQPLKLQSLMKSTEASFSVKWNVKSTTIACATKCKYQGIQLDLCFVKEVTHTMHYKTH